MSPGNPIMPFDDQFLTGVLWRSSQPKKKQNLFTYAELLNAPDMRGDYWNNASQWNQLHYVVVPLKNFSSAFKPQGQNNPYLPIKGYYWDAVSNSLKTKTYGDWHALEAAQFSTELILLIGLDKVADNGTTTFELDCDKIICGDGYCNEECGEQCASDCADKYKLELVQVALTEDALIDLTGYPHPHSADAIPRREPRFRMRYAINYSVIIVHADQTIEKIENKRYAHWRRKQVPKVEVNHAALSTNISSAGTETPKNITQVITNNFVPLGPKPDKIYIIFWEDDFGDGRIIDVDVYRDNPNNVMSTTTEVFVNDNSNQGDFETPYGNKIDATAQQVNYLPESDASPKHFKIVKAADFSNNNNQSGEYEYVDIINDGSKTTMADKPPRGGQYGLSFKLKWTKL